LPHNTGYFGSYAASHGWLIVEDDTLTLTVAGLRFEGVG
jgi:hypothetical protein